MGSPYVTPATRCARPGCENIRKESNHWFLLYFDSDSSNNNGGSLCSVYRFNYDVLASDDRLLPICGEACLLKMISARVQKGTTN